MRISEIRALAMSVPLIGVGLWTLFCRLTLRFRANRAARRYGWVGYCPECGDIVDVSFPIGIFQAGVGSIEGEYSYFCWRCCGMSRWVFGVYPMPVLKSTLEKLSSSS